MVEQSMNPKPNLDLLRSVAILLVVLDHVLVAQHLTRVGPWQSDWIGVVGVYWFFVHTSLVLMWSLERKPYTLDFYIRRVFRIYPLAILVILVTLALHAPITTFFVYHIGRIPSVLANLLLAQNFTYGNHNVVGVMWSLPLEVDMYLLLPAMFFFIRKNFSLWPLLLFWVLAAGMARVSIGYGNNFYTVIPCFIPGLMAYVLFQRERGLLPAWLFPLSLLLVLAVFMHDPSVSASWPMCLALGLGLPFYRQITSKALVRMSHELAKYSYGIYLTHSFGLVIGFYLLRGMPWWVRVSIVIVSTGVFSFVAYHVLEKPLIDLGARLASRVERRYEQKRLSEAL